MSEFNEPGHVDPASGLVAIPLLDFRRLPDGTKGFIYTRAPRFGGSGLDPWRTIRSIAPHAYDAGFDVWFNESSMGLSLNPSVVSTQVIYVEEKNAPRAAHDPAQYRVASAFDKLRDAVQMAREAVERADRELARYSTDATTAARLVLSGLANGHAAAMLEITAAMSAIEDAHIIRRTVAEEKPR